MQQTTEELQLRIRELEKEISRLHKAVKEQRYGLNWLDIPEAFETESENKIPILEEVKDKAIVNNDGKPTHILIEGDNYHALTCLNYTHKGKIDVIYIDPPYNTGSDGFTYRDKRIQDKFPDGTTVDKNNAFRHSYWLSFMSKRLDLAKNLLSDKGVIYISIDDNEVAQLKLLCDSDIGFGESNFVGTFIWTKKKKGSHLSKTFRSMTEYVLCYSKNINNLELYGENAYSGKQQPIAKRTNAIKILIFDEGVIKTTLKNGIYNAGFKGKGTSSLNFKNDFVVENGVVKTKVLVEGPFVWVQRKLDEEIKKGTSVFLSNKFGFNVLRSDQSEKIKRPSSIINSEIGVGTNEDASSELIDLLKQEGSFLYPKPTTLLQYLINSKTYIKKDSIVLDFFAGSGTALHATMKLNEEDEGIRQCILVQTNENNICEDVTYKRNTQVINGYTNSEGVIIEGLGNSLKYYRTSFVGKNNPSRANDTDKVELSHKAGYLLALSENTLNEITKGSYYQVFVNEQRATAIYFQEDLSEIEQFVASVVHNGKQTAVYIFSWSNGEEFLPMFDHLPHVAIKTIPQPILEIYRSINK